MVVAHFLKWIATARVSERAAAAAALARAFINHELPFEDRCAAEAALTIILDDPSSKVRAAMAEVLAPSAHAPAQIVAGLAADQPEVAAPILARSPILGDGDLIDRVASGVLATQSLVAARPKVSMAVAAALAEVGEAEACAVLLRNPSAEIASISFRRMAERFGQLAIVREAMIGNRRIPSDCRHLLLVKLGEALRQSRLVGAVMSGARAERVMRDACARASLMVIDGTRADEHGALVEHLRLRGDLTAGFLIRTIAHGKIDFFGSALVALTKQAESRVMSLLAAGSDVAVCALLRSAGLQQATHAVILVALKVWRDVAKGKRMAGAQEVTFAMLKEIGGQGATGDIAGLLKSIHLEALRDNARDHALAIAAA